MKTIFAFFLSIFLSGMASAQELSTPDDDRKKVLASLGSGPVPDIDLIRKSATAIFDKPVGQQSEQELTDLATEANRLSNLIGFIREEYDSYNRENYRYEFVQKKVAGARDEYVKLSNEFIRIRNQAYFNLGEKNLNSGNELAALMYFRDAFRLSGFDCGKGTRNQCMRWLAEQKMKEILGISHVTSYVTWQ